MMKRAYRYLIIFFLLLSYTPLEAQEAKKEVKFRGAYYEVRRSAHDMEGLPINAVVFMGNSITEQGWWKMLFKTKNIVNRGIGGDNTFGMLDRITDILKAKPSKIFFMGGINDLTAGLSQDTIVFNIRKMIHMAKDLAPHCEFYVQSVLPISDDRLAYPGIKGKNPSIKELNCKLELLCTQEGVRFLNIAPLLTDQRGQLRTELTKDGIHLHPEAYEIWSGYIKKNRLLK